MAHKIRLMIVDDRYLLRKGLIMCLHVTDDITVVGEAANGVQAVEQSSLLQPDVILMDINLSKMDGIVATRIISEQNPKIKILIFTTLEDEVLIQAAVKAGAVGYLHKNISIQRLVDTIRSVSNRNAGSCQTAQQSF